MACFSLSALQHKPSTAILSVATCHDAPLDHTPHTQVISRCDTASYPPGLSSICLSQRRRRNLLPHVRAEALSIMKKSKLEALIIKNCAQVGPEGQTKTVSATLCNAGFPPYDPGFLSSGLVEQGKYEEERRKSLESWGEQSRYIRRLGGPCEPTNFSCRS